MNDVDLIKKLAAAVKRADRAAELAERAVNELGYLSNYTALGQSEQVQKALTCENSATTTALALAQALCVEAANLVSRYRLFNER